MDKMIYSKTITKEGNECLITKDAHVVEVYEDDEKPIAYVATCSTIARGWMGIDTRSQSFVYECAQDAIDYCENFFEVSKENNNE